MKKAAPPKENGLSELGETMQGLDRTLACAG